MKKITHIILIFFFALVFNQAGAEELPHSFGIDKLRPNSMIIANEDDSLITPVQSEKIFIIPNNGKVTYSISIYSTVNEFQKFRYSFTYSFGNLISKTREKWKSNNWIFEFRTTYSFNPNNQLVSELKELWKGKWEFSERSTNTYDSNGFLIYQFFENYKVTWIPNKRGTFINDSDGYVIQSLYKIYKDSSWKNESRNEYKYDKNKNVIYRMSESSDGNFWDAKSISNYVFDDNNKILFYHNEKNSYALGDYYWCNKKYFYNSSEQLILDSTETISFGNFDNYTDSYNYDSNNNLIVYVLEGERSYYDEGEKIINYYDKRLYKYDINNNLIFVESDEKNIDPEWSGFENHSEISNTYDKNNNLILKEVNIRRILLITDSLKQDTLDFNYRQSYIYDINNFMLSVLHESKIDSQWNNSDHVIHFNDVINNIEYQFLYSYKLEITYDELLSIHDEKPNDLICNNFPNPFENSTEIKYSVDKPGFVKIDIYNNLSEKITTLVNHYQSFGEHTATFYSGNSSPGVYYYIIQIGDRISTGKMILVK